MAYQNYYQPQFNPYNAYGGYTQPAAPAAPTAASFACRPVTSREEAVAAQVDFFGPGTLMPDLGHGVIYLKRFNQQTGACDLVEFTVQENREVRYATAEDLAALKEEILKEVKGDVSE